MKIHSVPTGAMPLIAAEFLTGHPIQNSAIITDNIDHTLEVLKFYGIEALAYPALDNLPYDLVLPSKRIVARRYRTLYESKQKPSILVTDDFTSLISKVVSKEDIDNYQISISRAEHLKREDLLLRLVDFGYEHTNNAYNYGEFAVRGSIIDICADNNFRIDFLSDEVESIKEFNPETQISITDSNIKQIHIFSLQQKSNINSNLESIFDYLPELMIIHQNDHAIDNIINSIQRNYEARKQTSEMSIIAPKDLYDLSFQEKITQRNSEIQLSNIYIKDTTQSSYESIALKNIQEVISFITRNTSRKILISMYSNGSYERAIKLLKQHDLPFQAINSYQELLPGINISILPIENSLYSDDLTIITEKSLFHTKLGYNIKKARKVIEYNDDYSINTFVIHKEYGIGQFLGLEQICIDNVHHECLKIAYANQDKIFVPVENIRLITRYASPDEEGVKLDKLGAKSWQIRKARIKKRIKLIADELMKIAAARKLKQGLVFDVQNADYQKFSEQFPYVETPEQLAAIENIEEDLSCGKVMDRLVCGDTGFGKTEVAMRAAFIGAQNGYQVVIVVPTTLLCQQHFANFKERFSGFPIRIAQVSRYNNSDNLKNAISDGQFDIIIGTHALFNVGFNNLSLLIIDEEHNFGVKQKEKLKQIKRDVHFLSLSATPIPRTLQMSLTGIRDLSLITTPPTSRIPSSNFVMTFDALTIKGAIMREHDRGGCSFYICPHIKNTDKLLKQLTALVPGLKIAIAHSKVKNIEKIISDFYHGKIDILIATPIVQSGLDISRANTIVIHQSELFGLTQLYQLKGRVGRSNVHAYVYFLVSHEDNSRIDDIKYLAATNNSFSVASYDMDNRGFGNLVGEEQSGHIKEVGLELYQQMLEDAISEHHEVEEVKINISISTGISDDYISDFKSRMNLYKRLSFLKNHTEVESFAAELIDRFGPIPDDTENLLHIVKLQQSCTQLSINKLDIGSKHTKITFGANPSIQLLEYIITNVNKFKILNDQQMTILKLNQSPSMALEIAKNELDKMIMHIS